MGIGTNIILLAAGAVGGIAFTKLRAGTGITIPLVNIQLVRPAIPPGIITPPEIDILLPPEEILEPTVVLT